MKGRDYGLYLEDILEAISRIEKYTAGLTYEKFTILSQGSPRPLGVGGVALVRWSV